LNKNIIMSFAYKYEDHKILIPWINSIKKINFDGDVVVIAINTSDSVDKILEDNKILVRKYFDDSNTHPNVLRFKYFFEFLNENKYSKIILTDIRDVIFQKNPFYNKYLNNNLYELVLSSENILLKDEPWSKNNVINTFGIDEYEKIKNLDALCAGVIAGKATTVKNLCLEIYKKCLESKTIVYHFSGWDSNKHWSQWSSDPPDQAAFNILIREKKWSEISKIVSIDEDWNINLGVSNINNIKLLLNEVGSFENGVVKNKNREEFFIVHQYDRIPELNNEILRMYLQ